MCVIFCSSSFKFQQNNLSFQVQSEEVFFLISRKVARVVEFLELEEPPGINVKSERELLVTQNLHFKFYQQFLR